MSDDLDATTTETPSETGVSEDLSETPSDETTEAPSSVEGEGETAETPSDDETVEAQPAGDDDEDNAWKNFNKKFDHIKSDRDRRAAMGKAWWEKTNYASQVRKENEELKARLARAEAPARDKPEEPETPATPPPELARIENRIQVLYQKDQAIQQQQTVKLQELATADREVGILEDKLKGAAEDDYSKAILEQRLETAKIKREGVLNRWADLNDKREAISVEMEQRLTDREWTQKFLKEQATREQLAKQDLETFNVEFPKQVDSIITSSADELGAPKDQKIRQGLWKSVNRAMMVDLWQLGEEGLSQVDVPKMVRAHVKEYLEERDLAGRAKFNKTSTEKVGTLAGRTPAGAPGVRPAAPKKAVPPALLSQGDTTPAMRRARELLTKRFGG